MKTQFTTSADGTSIAYSVSGSGGTALLFIHGWLGNKDWWLSQAEAFGKGFLIARMDLAGHGESGNTREEFTATKYADDIVAVANALPAKEIILIGHSMSGAYALEAAPKVKHLRKLIVVDTLKDILLTMDPKIIEQIFAGYKKDFPLAVRTQLPKFLYGKETPTEVVARLESEFLKRDADFAVKALRPLYTMDLPPMARSLKIPVRAINSDHSPTNEVSNKQTFPDYSVMTMIGTGHYPMLERPDEFNTFLQKALLL